MKTEGVIKFSCEWTKSNLPNGDYQLLLDIRNRLYALGGIGFDLTEDVGFGNISIRVNEAGAFIISGTQTGHIPVLTSNELSYVAYADQERYHVICSGPTQASSESVTHAAIYQQFPEAGAVIHVHHANTWQHLLHKAPTTREDIAYGTKEMAAEIARLAQEAALGEQKILVMTGHKDGIICFGEGLETAWEVLLQHWKS
jgi:L-ribulose-5-phosphate 4-epimerase